MGIANSETELRDKGKRPRDPDEIERLAAEIQSTVARTLDALAFATTGKKVHHGK